MEVKYLDSFVSLHRLVGLWPTDKTHGYGKYVVQKSLHLFGTVIVSFGVTVLILKILMDFEDLDNIATVVDCGTLYAADLFRLINYYIRGTDHIEFVAYMYSSFSYESFNPGPKKTSMAKYQKIALYFIVFYFSTGLIFALHVTFNPIIAFVLSDNMTQVPFVFEMWLPLDLNTEPNHTILFFIQIISWFYVTTSFLIIDSFWFTTMLLTIGQMHLITDSFKMIEQDLKGGDEFPIEYRQSFYQALRHHQLIRRFIQRLEGLLCYIVLVDFLHGIISITFILLEMNIMISEGEWFRLGSMLEYFMISIAHIFFLNFIGNEMQLQEEELAKAMYRVPWYSDMEHLATPMVLSTQACRKPNRLTGGKFYFLTNEFFVGAMRTIVSYFMVLQQFQ